jgi:hypothetical protein
MVSDDGVFEIELSEGGVPGVFLPTVSLVKARLSPAALSYFQAMRRNTSSERLEREFLEAVKVRWAKVGRRGGDVVVKTNDFAGQRTS